MNTSLELTNMKSTILHPTDFSPAAKNALEYAIELAKTLDSNLEIVYSPDYSGKLDVEQSALTLIDFTKQVEIENCKKANELQKFCKDKGVDCTTSTQTGKLVTWLPDYIAQSDPLLVVMGTNSANTISGKVFGSNAYTIIKNSNSPVLVVPITAKVKEFKRLVLSTDNRERDVEAIQFLMKLALPTSNNIDIVHVLHGNGSDSANEEELLHELRSKVEQAEDFDKVNYSLLNTQNAEQQLRQLSQDKDSDLITLTMQKKSFFQRIFSPSITAKMVHKSEVPLLVFSA